MKIMDSVSTEEENLNNVIKSIINDYIDYPEFLFYYDCRTVGSILKNEKGKK